MSRSRCTASSSSSGVKREGYQASGGCRLFSLLGSCLGLNPCCLLMWAEVPEVCFAKKASRDPVNRCCPVPLALTLALCAAQPDAAGTWQAWAARRQPSCEEGLCLWAAGIFSSTQCLQGAGMGIQHLLGAPPLQMPITADGKPCAQAP